MRYLLLLPVTSWATPADACTHCRPLVEARLVAEPFWPAVLAATVPALVLALVAQLTHHAGGGR